MTKSIGLAEALKAQYPQLVVFGPVNYGFEGIYSWQGGVSNVTPSGNNWFADQYLSAMHAAAASFGTPVVDVYDFHWYSQVSDGNGGAITDLNTSTLTDAQVQSIVQSPRSLWDTTYSENSWVVQVLGGPIYILGRLQAKIDAENPGMKISITEYNNGGAQHIAGTIAEADDLGIFGAQGLFAANLWDARHLALPAGRLPRVSRFRRCRLQLRRHLGPIRFEQCRRRCGLRQHRQHPARTRGVRRDQPLDEQPDHGADRVGADRHGPPVPDERGDGRRPVRDRPGFHRHPAGGRFVHDRNDTGAERHDDRRALSLRCPIRDPVARARARSSCR